jgi:KUP system potassium uptake protein
MTLWFAAIAISGAVAIVSHPAILAALNPLRAVWFVTHHGIFGFLIFGAIILGMTGAEALYADMSHFGRMPITRAWYVFVFPALILNYAGQAATIATDPKALDSPFYALAPGWTLLPMVALATAATIIASQSLISAAFTLTEQAIALNLSPRMSVLHTSKDERGQVYVPLINVLLAVVCVTLVVTFRSSDRLAAMFGLAVANTMLVTDIIFFVVAIRKLRWGLARALPLALAFGSLDATFVLAGLPKLLDGAWVPILLAAVVSLIAITWLTGRRAVARELRAQSEPIEEYAKEHPPFSGPPRSAVVLLTGDPTGVPFKKSRPLLDAPMRDQVVVLMTVTFPPRPYIPEWQRVAVDRLSENFVQLTARFGYMEPPRITPILHACGVAGLFIDDDSTAFVYSDPVIVGKSSGGMPRWQRYIFEIMQRLSRRLAEDLEIRANRRVEIGVEVAV